MKAKIDINKIKTFVVSLAILAFSLGGWVLFVFSEIRSQKEMTSQINIQTKEILDQMYRRDSAFNSFSLDPEFIPK